MGTDAINKSSGSTQVYQTQPSFGANVSLMNPDDILAYVQKALGDIGDQLNDFKNVVAQRQEKAKDLRELASTIRDMQTGGDLKGYNEAKYNEFMTNMSKYKDSDPAVGAAYDKFMKSYGGYKDVNTGKDVGTLAGADGKWIDHGDGDSQDMCLNAKELSDALKNIEDAQGNLNSENELTMMGLQQLMQKRNQISQFGSNAMNMMNEGMKSIIGNIR